MTNRRSKSVLFLFSMQNDKMQRRNTDPVRLTESADLCFSYGRIKQSRTQQNQPLTLCPANNVSKKLHQKG